MNWGRGELQLKNALTLKTKFWPETNKEPWVKPKLGISKNAIVNSAISFLCIRNPNNI